MINTELLEKFKRLYQMKYNITLSDEEATQAATDFVNLMKILLRPKPKKVQFKQPNQEVNQI